MGNSPSHNYLVGYSSQRHKHIAAAGGGGVGWAAFFSFLLAAYSFFSSSWILPVFISHRFLSLYTRGRWSPCYRALGGMETRMQRKEKSNLGVFQMMALALPAPGSGTLYIHLYAGTLREGINSVWTPRSSGFWAHL